MATTSRNGWESSWCGLRETHWGLRRVEYRSFWGKTCFRDGDIKTFLPPPLGGLPKMTEWRRNWNSVRLGDIYELGPQYIGWKVDGNWPSRAEEELVVRGQSASGKPGGAQGLEAPGIPEKLEWVERLKTEGWVEILWQEQLGGQVPTALPGSQVLYFPISPRSRSLSSRTMRTNSYGGWGVPGTTEGRDEEPNRK